jgi:hypothetical protein
MCEAFQEHYGMAVALPPDQAFAEGCSLAKIELCVGFSEKPLTSKHTYLNTNGAPIISAVGCPDRISEMKTRMPHRAHFDSWATS